jgi:hypothetical protein
MPSPNAGPSRAEFRARAEEEAAVAERWQAAGRLAAASRLEAWKRAADGRFRKCPLWPDMRPRRRPANVAVFPTTSRRRSGHRPRALASLGMSECPAPLRGIERRHATRQ